MGKDSREGGDLPWVMSKHTLGSEESGNLSQSKALLRLNLELMNSWQVEATAGGRKGYINHKWTLRPSCGNIIVISTYEKGKKNTEL